MRSKVMRILFAPIASTSSKNIRDGPSAMLLAEGTLVYHTKEGFRRHLFMASLITMVILAEALLKLIRAARAASLSIKIKTLLKEILLHQTSNAGRTAIASNALITCFEFTC